MKYVACTSGLGHFIRIDGIGEVAVQSSKIVHLTGTLSGIFTAASLVLDILSVNEDNEALEDMDNLAKNGQISRIKSDSGKFIVEMRNVINELQNTMDELEKLKDNILEVLQSEPGSESESESERLPRMFESHILWLCFLCFVLLFGFFVILYCFIL